MSMYPKRDVIWHKLDRSFFEKILRKHERDDSVVVSKVDVKNACEVGENFMSVVKRASVIGSRIIDGVKEDVTRHMIIKQVIDNKDLMDQFPFLRMFENEMNGYREILPELKKYTCDSKLPVAECIYADECTIVMNDLSQEGYVNVDKRLGFTIEQARYILQVLGKFHAASIVMSRRNPGKLEELSTKIQDVFFSSTSKLIQIQITDLEVAVKIFENLQSNPARNTLVIEKLKKLKSDVVEKQTAIINKERKFRVLNHGDTWGNNILLKEDDVKLVDLQIMRYSSVASDLSYFLYINLRPKVRHANLSQLLSIYLECLNENVEKMGFDMKNVLTMEWLEAEMKEFSLVGFMSSLMLLPVFCFNKDDLNIKDANVEEVGNADYQWSKCTPEYKERVVEIVLDYLQIDD